jgi:hypothetical protein
MSKEVYLIDVCELPVMAQLNSTLKNVNNGLNANIYSSLEPSGGQSSYLYLNFVHFFSASLNMISVAA